LGEGFATVGAVCYNRIMSEIVSGPFIEVVGRVAAANPGRPAVDDVTYGALWQGAGRVAKRFAELGVGRGDRVSLYCENRLGFVLGYLATLRLGAIAVPTNVLYRASDLGTILEDAAPKLILGSSQTAAHVPPGHPFVDAADVEAWAREPGGGELERDATVSVDDVAVLIFTSGTTGRAKGAMLSHGNLTAIARQVAIAWRWTGDDTLLLTLPLFHVHGLGAGLNGTLVAGGRIVVRERFDVDDAIARFKSGEITLFFGVPTMYVRFIERVPPQHFEKMRLFVSGSAALPADVHEAFEQRFGASILERYGSTEFGFALGNRYEGPRVVGAVGIPLSEIEVEIVAPGTAEPVARGETGELLVSGPNVFQGYWRRPEATADAFVLLRGRRFFRSGDLARFDTERGVYVIAGRLKELIISGGFNVYPLEVEAVMRRFPGVRDCALVGVHDSARGEIPVAFVEAESGAAFDTEAFLAAMREQLASFKVPKRVSLVAELPRNALGKVEKTKLAAQLV
jgi:malonyl-CoA/methylmalonyl-CoA synthetase